MNIAVMASGKGTTLESLIHYPVPIKLVLADRTCRALELAEQADISAIQVDRRNFGYAPGVKDAWDRQGFTGRIAEILKDDQIDLVAMAGFMTILDPVIFKDFGGRILNIHPSLLPAFKGEFAVRDALAAGVTETGSTVHVATEELDQGAILGQVKVPILPGDTVDQLWDRIKEQEHLLYPRVVDGILKGQITLPSS
jgi:phosphoribosylglycinamide formyltransferase 1